VEPVDILFGIDGEQHALLVDAVGNGNWTR